MITILALLVMLVWGRIAPRRDWKPFAAMAVIALLLGLIGGSRDPLELAASSALHFGALLLFFLQGIAIRRWTQRAVKPVPAAKRSAGRVEIDPGLLAGLKKTGGKPGRGERP